MLRITPRHFLLIGLLLALAMTVTGTLASASPVQPTGVNAPAAQVADCTPGPNKILTGCVYDGQDLGAADFSGSDLTSATFNGANIPGANFSNTNLTSATFNGANIPCANFNGANVTATTFDGANLLGSTFNGAVFVSETWGATTTCPDGTVSGANGNTCMATSRLNSADPPLPQQP